jgi:hypothetical protein
MPLGDQRTPNGDSGGGYAGSELFTSAEGPEASNPYSPKFHWRGEDPNAVTYQNGVPVYQGAEQDVARYQGLGAQWANMQAPQTDYGQANRFLGMGGDDWRQQQQALELSRQAALGQAPSVAAQQMAMGNDAAMRSQLAMAGSARGAGAMGAAYYGAGQNMGNLQAQNIAQTGALRAQEMAAARGEYMAGATGMRNQAYSAAGLTGGWAQNQAALEMQQRQLAAGTQLGYEQMGYNVNNAQLQALIAQQAQAEGHWMAQSGLDQASQQAATSNAIDAGSGAAGAVGAFMPRGGR